MSRRGHHLVATTLTALCLASLLGCAQALLGVLGSDQPAGGDSLLIHTPPKIVWARTKEVLTAWGFTVGSEQIVDAPAISRTLRTLPEPVSPFAELRWQQMGPYADCASESAGASDAGSVVLEMSARPGDPVNASTWLFVSPRFRQSYSTATCPSKGRLERLILSTIQREVDSIGGAGRLSPLARQLEQDSIRARDTWAYLRQRELNNRGYDLTMSSVGEGGRVLMIRYILATEVFAARLERMDSLFGGAKAQGYSEIWLTDGNGRDWRWPVE